jgi:hypothetical protein
VRWLLAVPAVTNAISVPFALLYLFLPTPGVALPMYIGVTLLSSASGKGRLYLVKS